MMLFPLLMLADVCVFDAAKGTIGPGAQANRRSELAASMELSQGDRFTYAGETYVRFGEPHEMTAFELQAFEAVGEKGTVPLFTDGSGDDSVYYVLVKSEGCVFQRYAKQ